MLTRGALLVVAMLLASGARAQNDVVKDDSASRYNLNKPARETWLRNTALGMFIHFSLDVQLGIVISHSLVGASEEYTQRFFNELPQTFDPAHFDPVSIARLAKLAGMKFIIFTTKHHSGFCMWNTQTTSFNIMHTPYGRDILQEWVKATREAGLGVGFYFSPEDFYFLHQHQLPISRTDVQMSDEVRKAYDDYTRRQCEELMRNYGKIDVLFIDGEPKEVVKTTCWKLQPDLLITRGALKTPEQSLPGTAIADPWLSPITIGTAWQYQPTNERYKSGTYLIELLIEARSKGGTLVLNTGPKPDGALPVEQEDRLRELAGWYFINQEAVDSVRPWVVSHEGNTWYTSSLDGKTVFAIVTHVAGWKEGDRRSIVLHAVKSTAATHVSVLGQNSQIIEYNTTGKRVDCRFSQTDTGLVVSVVKAQRIYDDHRWPNPVVVKIENALPAIRPIQVFTLAPRHPAKGKWILRGRLAQYATGNLVKAKFLYRQYKGQVEDLYAGPWLQTSIVQLGANGIFEVRLSHWKKELSYEYKAVIEYNGVQVDGDATVVKAD